MTQTALDILADRIQLMLNDAAVGTWPQATIESWVCEAIRDYSQYFPRTRTVSQLVTSSPDHTWDLQPDFLGIIQVEYPTGENPPEYLTLRSRRHDNFWDEEGYYDIEPSGDAVTQGVLYLSEIPTAGEYIGVTYLAPHDPDLGSSDKITVPVEHEFLLELHVLWTAFKERAATHLQDPDTTTMVLQKMVNAEMQAHEEYRRAIRNAEQHRSKGGWTGPWKTDIYDPIY